MSSPGTSRDAVLPPAVRAAFSPMGIYLDTGSIGLPPQPVVEAVADDLERWRAGRVRAPDYDEPVGNARELFAALVGVPVASVAIGATVSSFAGLVAASLPDGAEVLAPEHDFTSVLFPFAAQAPRGVRLRTVPLEDLAAAISPETSLVAFSLVQSADGRVADLDAVVTAARTVGAETFVDATQAAGWLPIDATAVDYLATAAYKWLLSPRGATFACLSPDRRQRLLPLAAGWYAGPDVWSSIYGLPLRLADDARRFDISPAWLSWVGAAAALRFLDDVGVAAVHAHDVHLANRMRAHLGLQASNSAILAVPGRIAKTGGSAGADVAATLAAAGIQASVRAGAVRLCFHLYNTPDDVDAAAAALTPPRTSGR